MTVGPHPVDDAPTNSAHQRVGATTGAPPAAQLLYLNAALADEAGVDAAARRGSGCMSLSRGGDPQAGVGSRSSIVPEAPETDAPHSHSIVAGGLLDTS